MMRMSITGILSNNAERKTANGIQLGISFTILSSISVKKADNGIPGISRIRILCTVEYKDGLLEKLVKGTEVTVSGEVILRPFTNERLQADLYMKLSVDKLLLAQEERVLMEEINDQS